MGDEDKELEEKFKELESFLEDKDNLINLFYLKKYLEKEGCLGQSLGTITYHDVIIDERIPKSILIGIIRKCFNKQSR